MKSIFQRLLHPSLATLFLRYYLSALLALVLIISVVGVVIDQIYTGVDEENGRNFMRGTVVLIEAELERHPEQEWPNVLAKMAPAFSYKLALTNLSHLQALQELDDGERQDIVRGLLHMEMDGLVVYSRIGDSQRVLVLGPLNFNSTDSDSLLTDGTHGVMRNRILFLLCFLLVGLQAFAQVAVSGKVIDAQGLEMPGVNVAVKGAAVGTMTGSDGRFTLSSIPGGSKAVLQFSFIGYKTQEVQLGNQRVLNITLAEDVEKLEEVVVVAYGTQKKKDLTGSLTQVDSKVIGVQSVSTVSKALEGAIPGLQVASADGQPGIDMGIRVRGVSSASGGGTALVVIDGVPAQNDNPLSNMTRKVIVKDGDEISIGKLIAIMGSGLVGALAYTFSDTFWFSAVEGEVYASSSLFTAVVFWLMLKWEEVADKPHSDRWIVLIAYLMGLSIGVHLLNLLCIPAMVLIYYYKKFPNPSAKGSLLALLVSFAIIALMMFGVVQGLVEVCGYFEFLFVNILGMPSVY